MALLTNFKEMGVRLRKASGELKSFKLPQRFGGPSLISKETPVLLSRRGLTEGLKLPGKKCLFTEELQSFTYLSKLFLKEACFSARWVVIVKCFVLISAIITTASSEYLELAISGTLRDFY